MKKSYKLLAGMLAAVCLLSVPVPKAKAGFLVGISGTNVAFNINSGQFVYQAPTYGYVYYPNGFCYRLGYGWYYAPWGGGPWMQAPAGFLLPPPLVYGSSSPPVVISSHRSRHPPPLLYGHPPPLVDGYRPYFLWGRGYVGPWYAIHQPVWWRENHRYIEHYTVWRTHVGRVYGPCISPAVRTQPRALSTRPRFFPPGHPDALHWAQRQWGRNRPDFYGHTVVRSFYRQHPMLARWLGRYRNGARMGHPYRYGRPYGYRGNFTGRPQHGIIHRLGYTPGSPHPAFRPGPGYRPLGLQPHSPVHLNRDPRGQRGP